MLSLTDILDRVARGDLGADAAVAQSREAASRDPHAAFVRLADAPRAGRGPLAGVAVGVKDIIDTADMATEMGSPIYAGWRPRADAPVVARLRALGATPVGKNSTTAFAHLEPTPTRNPRNPAHTPGGSSSGSAAAVAAGLVPLALGTQTGGSVIRPAAFCGIAAIKPSFRLLPTVGVKCFSWTLDTVGLFAAGSRDLAVALAHLAARPALAGVDEGPALRLGVARQDFAGAAEPAAEEALVRAVRAAEAAGAQVSDLALPEELAEAWRLQPTIQDFEAAQALAWEYDNHRAALPASLAGLLERAGRVEAAAYDDARGAANRARRALRAAFREAGIDALLTYPAPGPAPAGLGSTGDPRFNRLWTLLGVPAATVPVTEAGGLPVGVQVIAPFGADEVALRAARLIERSLAGSGHGSA